MAIEDLLLNIKHRRLIALLAPAAAVLVLGLAMVVFPRLAGIRTLQASKDELTKKAAVFANIVSDEKKVSLLKERLMTLEDKTKMIDEINTAANDSGLTINSMAPAEATTVGAFLNYVSVRIDAVGNIHRLGEFASRIENMHRFVKIIGVEINTEDSDSAMAFSTQGMYVPTTGAAGPMAFPQSASPANAPAGRGRPRSPSTYKIMINLGLFSTQKDAL